MILLTSFKKAVKLNGWQVFSVARWQPKGVNLPELKFFAAEDGNGSKLVIQASQNSYDDYKKALWKGYRSRWDEIQKWLDGLQESDRIALACWCPYSKISQEQLQKSGIFACHTGLIGRLVKRYRPDIQIFLDDDRQKSLFAEWR